jgi:hypothetical protein
MHHGICTDMLKSRTTWPPGGWLFLEPATGWRAPTGLTFDQVVKAIIEHRLRNRQHQLATDHNTVAQQLDDYTCARLKNNSHWCAKTNSEPFQVPLPAPSLRAEAKNVVGGVRFFENVTAGIKLWLDWFGDGKPVDKNIAENRAQICSTCPQNDKTGNVLEWFTGIAAKEIMAIFSVLKDLNLATSKDEELKVCQACDCPLKAKVWTPLQIIKKHLTKERLDRLDPRCWIRHE